MFTVCSYFVHIYLLYYKSSKELEQIPSHTKGGFHSPQYSKERGAKLLKTLLEQFTTDECTQLHSVKQSLTTKYTYYNSDLKVYLSATVTTPFEYPSEQMLSLVHSNLLTITNVTISLQP